MKYGFLVVILLGLATLEAKADITPPTCDEEPTRRDCVKVEDPDATPPRHTVDQNKIKPVQLPGVKPRPKAGR